MLARLGNAWAAVVSFRRRVLPRGVRYELFDCSMLLLVIGVCAYVLTTPPPSTAVALQAPLRIVSETQLGVAMTLAALAGIVTACTPWPRFGYVATIAMTLALSLNFLVGFISTDAGWRALAQAVLYGWVARRLLREARAL